MPFPRPLAPPAGSRPSFVPFVVACLLALPTLSPAQGDGVPPGTNGVTEIPDVRLYEDVQGLRGEARPLSVHEVVLATLLQNLDVQISELDRNVAGNQVLLEFGIYDPQLSATVASTRDDTQQFPGSRASNDSTVNSVGAGVSQLTPLGSVVYLEANDARLDRGGTGTALFSEVTYQDSLTLGINQPLLKNFGPMVTNSRIRIARRELDQANLLFRSEVQERLALVMKAYWDLVLRIQLLDVERQALASARELERVNRARVDVGRIPRLNLVQAQAQVAQREFLVSEAERNIAQAQDTLLRLMNWDRSSLAEQWDRPILPTDRPVVLKDLELVDDFLVEAALSNRPDYQAAKYGIDIARINRDVTRWQRLPELNAFAEYSVAGWESRRSDALAKVTGSREFDSYTVGAELRFPLFNRRARAQHRQALDQLEQVELGLESFALGITAEVRAASRALRTSLVQIDAANRQVQADLEKLEAEQLRLEVGERTTFDVLDFQDDLAASRANQVRALANHQVALVELARSTGSILALQGVAIDDEMQPGAWGLRYTPAADNGIDESGVMQWDDAISTIPIRVERERRDREADTE